MFSSYLSLVRNSSLHRHQSDDAVFQPSNHGQGEDERVLSPASLTNRHCPVAGPRRLARPAHVGTGSRKGPEGRDGKVNKTEHKTSVATGLASGK